MIITKRNWKSNVFLQNDDFFKTADLYLSPPGLYEPFYAPVIGFFRLFREKAAGHFTPRPVVGHALAADTPLRT
jgi:hypothetical protein